jgi:hypothetical protein
MKRQIAKHMNRQADIEVKREKNMLKTSFESKYLGKVPFRLCCSFSA